MSRTRSVARATGTHPEDIPLPPAHVSRSRTPAPPLSAAAPISGSSTHSRRTSGSQHSCTGSRSGTRTPSSNLRNDRGEDPEFPGGNPGDGGDDKDNGGDDSGGDDGDGNGEDGDEDGGVPDKEDLVHNLPTNDRLLYGLLNCISDGLAARNSSQPPAAPPKTPKVAIKEPTIFNGKEPLKLNEFIFQCRLYFDANIRQFPSDHTKCKGNRA